MENAQVPWMVVVGSSWASPLYNSPDSEVAELKYIVSKSIDIDVAHKLPWHKGKCQKLHGHTLTIRVAVSSFKLDGNGIVVDFGQIKEFLNSIKDVLDHQYLNEIQGLVNPTAENICNWISTVFSVSCIEWGVSPEYIEVWETKTCCVRMEYS